MLSHLSYLLLTLELEIFAFYLMQNDSFDTRDLLSSQFFVIVLLLNVTMIEFCVIDTI